MEAFIAASGFSLTVIAALWKVFGVVGDLRTDIAEVGHKIEKLELTTNGVRERMEHINTRVSANQRELNQTVDGIDRWLNKNTEYTSRLISH